MELRKELEPESNLEVVQKLYPIIKEKILNFTDFWDNYPEKSEERHEELQKELSELTGKDVSQYNLWEYWEEEGIEILSFRISQPKPNKILDFTKEELKEIIRRVMNDSFTPPDTQENEEEFLIFFEVLKQDFYFDLIKENFDTYDRRLFMRNKDKKGHYFTYSIDEITEKIWGGKD